MILSTTHWSVVCYDFSGMLYDSDSEEDSIGEPYIVSVTFLRNVGSQQLLA